MLMIVIPFTKKDMPVGAKWEVFRATLDLVVQESEPSGGNNDADGIVEVCCYV